MLIVDTGFLVALYIRRDKLHQQALQFLQKNEQALITTAS
jgi:predicted nucleic acid-binding protein